MNQALGPRRRRRSARGLVGGLAVALFTLLGSGRLPAAAAPAAAADVAALPNTYCPVLTDRRADPAFHVTYEGREVYFCCATCRRKFLAAPADYLAHLPQFGGVEPALAAPAASSGASALVAAVPSGRPGSLREALGRFHPVAVHFPLALLLGAALAEALWLLSGWEPARRAVPFLVVTSVPTAWLAALLGLAMAATTPFAPAQAGALALHRTAGLVTAVLATLAWSALRWREHTLAGRRRLFLVLLLLAAAAVALAGRQGGVLVWGADWLPF